MTIMSFRNAKEYYLLRSSKGKAAYGYLGFRHHNDKMQNEIARNLKDRAQTET